MSKTDWGAIPGPPYYSPIAAEEILNEMAGSKLDFGHTAALRRAVGNDHAGTLYPAAVAATGELFKLMASSPALPRGIALAVLLDWWGMFKAEPGYEIFEAEDGSLIELIPAIVNIAKEHRSLVEEIAREDPVYAKQAKLLLKCIDAGWVVLDY